MFLSLYIRVKFCSGSLKEVNSKLNHTVKDLTTELKDFKERLTNTNSELCNVDVSIYKNNNVSSN